MKVWELMAKLSEMPAGKQIIICLPSTNANYGLEPTEVTDSDPKDKESVINIFTVKS